MASDWHDRIERTANRVPLLGRWLPQNEPAWRWAPRTGSADGVPVPERSA